MYYYEVYVSHTAYRASSALIYHSPEVIPAGTVVFVQFGKYQSSGFVAKKVRRPKFVTKPIAVIYHNVLLPVRLRELHDWLAKYYPAPIGAITQLILPSNIKQPVEQYQPGAYASFMTSPHKLTDDQNQAIRAITKGSGSFLLHGDTGSGKTHVYIELTKLCLSKQQSALILTPEIGLTPQLAAVFEQTFGQRVVVMHSGQTPATRRKTWLRIIQSTEQLVVIGPRSALFCPLQSIGLIVMDEAHDNAYKQEQLPYYQSSRVAGKLAQLHGARLVLGSATPTVTDYALFKQKELPIIRMAKIGANNNQTTQIVIDIKDRSEFNQSPWISNTLLDSIAHALTEKTQSLVYLNRRGTARMVLCTSCGWLAECHRCNTPLTYHGDKHHLRCHTCGNTQPAPSQCPVCNKTDITFKSIGTKTLETELLRLFPNAVVARFDGDNTVSERMDKNYKNLVEGHVDVIIGTQVVSKGLDLPKLAVVGVITADSHLFFPDFTSQERTFQSLRQVIGRVGRGHRHGTIIVQTYFPTSSVIQSALNNDYRSFYAHENQERRDYGYPPYYHLMKITFERSTSASAQRSATITSQAITALNKRITVVGPMPAFIEKVNNGFRWNIIIKAKNRSLLLDVIQTLPKNCRYDLDPNNLL